MEQVPVRCCFHVFGRAFGCLITEFAGGRLQPGQQAWPGLIAHSPEYAGRVILRALRTGEERIGIPPGPEQPDLLAVPGA